MKKISLVVVGLATIGVLGLGQSAHAEETTAEETTASVLVKSGGIKISKTSNITFEDVTVKKGGSTAQETKKSSIEIEDLRGSSSKGWELTAKLKDQNFGGMALNVTPKIESNNTVAKPGTSANLGSTAQTIATVADADIKTTEFDTNVSLNAKLTVPEKQLANTYTTTIVWNLAEGPGTK